MVSKNFGFYVKRCMNKPNCKTKPEIDKYVSDISIEGWNIQESINFNIYDSEKPVYKVMDKFGSWLLNPNIIKDQYQYLR